MDDSPNIPEAVPPKESPELGPEHESIAAAELSVEQPAALAAQYESFQSTHASVTGEEDTASRRQRFRQNLFVLLSLALAAFILTSWILVRVDSPFGILASGPQEVVRAQLRALDRGELRPAYNMFSARYREHVSFDTWHELFVKHWRMFHADVVRSDEPLISGPGVTLEIYLHGADDRNSRARFTLVRADGRWWIDDVHWAEEADESNVSRT